jgi:hypothetical protein
MRLLSMFEFWFSFYVLQEHLENPANKLRQEVERDVILAHYYQPKDAEFDRESFHVFGCYFSSFCGDVKKYFRTPPTR